VLGHIHTETEQGQEEHMKRDQEDMDSERDQGHTPVPRGQNCTLMNHKNGSTYVWVPLVPVHKGCTSVPAGERHREDMISSHLNVVACQGWAAAQWV